MTIHTLAADICDRIPEMARDSKTNNQKVIENLLTEFLTKQNHERETSNPVQAERQQD